MGAGWMGAGGVKGRGAVGSAREMGADRKERLYLCLAFWLQAAAECVALPGLCWGNDRVLLYICVNSL